MSRPNIRTNKIPLTHVWVIFIFLSAVTELPYEVQGMRPAEDVLRKIFVFSNEEQRIVCLKCQVIV